MLFLFVAHEVGVGSVESLGQVFLQVVPSVVGVAVRFHVDSHGAFVVKDFNDNIVVFVAVEYHLNVSSHW